ncbi:MAG: DUF6746 family protein [bacterium]
MRQILLITFALLFSLPALAADESNKKPIQHLAVADITSMTEAKAVFLDKTAELGAFKTVGLLEASQIHIITYTLEKSVAYFADNLTGEKQQQAKEIAVVVEDIHISSESNNLESLKNNLKIYSELVDKFIFCF